MRRVEFARRIQVSPAYITRLCKTPSEFWPGRDVMQRIIKITRGKVQPNDFF